MVEDKHRRFSYNISYFVVSCTVCFSFTHLRFLILQFIHQSEEPWLLMKDGSSKV